MSIKRAEQGSHIHYTTADRPGVCAECGGEVPQLTTVAAEDVSAFLSVGRNYNPLVVVAENGREIVRFTRNGEVILGEGYTPSQAAEEFWKHLRPIVAASIGSESRT